MDKQLSLTIVNNENLRGVLAPAKYISKELLEDILDLIAYSRPKAVAAINWRFKKINKNELVAGEHLRKKLGI